jgi:hypothetical protein
MGEEVFADGSSQSKMALVVLDRRTSVQPDRCDGGEKSLAAVALPAPMPDRSKLPDQR